MTTVSSVSHFFSGAVHVTPSLSPPVGHSVRRSRIVKIRVVAALSALAAGAALVGTWDRPAAANPESGQSALAQASANWPQWRGPTGNGVAPHSDAPLHFSSREGVKWKVEIPGRGFSSPIVWDDLVFVTTAVATAEEMRSVDRPRRRRSRLVPHDFRLIAVRRDDGEVAWSRTATVTLPHEGYHRTLSSYANPSPVTDGERVYAFFGSRGLYAFDFDGKVVWARDFGVEMETFGHFGEASSPALFGDTIVVVFDHQGESFIEALDTRDGSTRWRRPRDEGTSWSSPYIVEHDGAILVVTSAGNSITAYDIGSGRIEWRSPGLMPGPIPTPVAGGGLLFVASGSRERRVRAIDLSRAAEVGGAAIAWELARAAPYNPSPLLWGDELYLVRDGGMNAGTSRMSLIDARTGEARYMQERLPGAYTIKASPVGAGDKVYLLTEEGDVLVLRRGAPLEVLAINPMGEAFVASPAIAHGELFLRSRNHLFCIDGR